MLYACDEKFWRTYLPARHFAGLRIAGCDWAARELGTERLFEEYTTQMAWRTLGWIGTGGNSGFQLLNFFAQCGLANIALLGFDMHVDRGTHFHGDHPMGMNNPDAVRTAAWADCFDRAAPTLAARGVDVVNATPGSALRCFRRINLRDFL